MKVMMKMNCLGREEEQCSSLRAEWAPAPAPDLPGWSAPPAGPLGTSHPSWKTSSSRIQVKPFLWW